MPKLNEDRMFTVYKLVFPNGKIYIGITSCSFKKRMREHKLKELNKDKTKLGCAIKKYGWSNISSVVISDNISKEDACKMEIYFISKLKTTDINFGYNTALGGEINYGYKINSINPHIYTKEELLNRSKKCSETKKSNIIYKKIASDNSSRFPVIALNILTQEKFEFKNASVCEDFLNYRRGRVYDHIMRNSKILDKKWIIRRKQKININN